MALSVEAYLSIIFHVFGVFSYCSNRHSLSFFSENVQIVCFTQFFLTFAANRRVKFSNSVSFKTFQPYMAPVSFFGTFPAHFWSRSKRLFVIFIRLLWGILSSSVKTQICCQMSRKNYCWSFVDENIYFLFLFCQNCNLIFCWHMEYSRLLAAGSILGCAKIQRPYACELINSLTHFTRHRNFLSVTLKQTDLYKLKLRESERSKKFSHFSAGLLSSSEIRLLQSFNLCSSP